MRKISYIPRILIRSDVGHQDWAWYSQWVRSAVRVDELGFAVYRPRPDSFYAKDLPDVAAHRANQWNIANAGRPLEVLAMGRKLIVQIDTLFTEWPSVRKAIGILDRRADLNIGLPSPEDLDDAELVNIWGIDYALDLWRRRHATAEKDRLAFEAAISRYEKKIERALTKMERDATEDLRSR